MDIHHEITGTKGSFSISDQETILAQMTYSKAGDDLIIIDHTEVSDALSGKGIGKQLVNAAVEYARKESIKIMPLCSFAKAIFRKDESIRDVLR